MKNNYYGIIYTISCKRTHKVLYIGQTINSIKHRWNQHWSDTRHSSLPHANLKKYGRNNFYISEFLYSFDKESLNIAEISFIKVFKTHVSFGGWNISFGGSSFGIFSNETKLKISKSKFKPLIAIELKTGKEFYFESTLNASKELNITRGHISNVCLGVRKSHKGYIFKYINNKNIGELNG